LRHTLTTQGYGIRLRPVHLEDAPFIVWLRNLDYVKGRVGDSAEDIESQKQWLNNYFERKGDYYFIVETWNATPLGTYGAYNMTGTEVEIGRTVFRPAVLALVPSTVLLLDLLYGQMGITQVRAATVASNLVIHSLLRKGGFSKVEVGPAARVIAGHAVDLSHFVQTAEDWRQARERSHMASRRGESAILQWEQSNLSTNGGTFRSEIGQQKGEL